MKNRDEIKMVVFDIDTLNVLLFPSQQAVVKYFGVRQSTISQAQMRGAIYDERWVICKAEDFKHEGQFQYDKIKFTPKIWVKIFAKEIKELNHLIGRNFAKAVKAKVDRIYILDDSKSIQKVMQTYQEVSDYLEMPIGTVRSKLHRAPEDENAIIIKASDYPEFIKNYN